MLYPGNLSKNALDAIVAKLRKSPEAVRKKIDRLGLEVVDLKGP